MRAAIFGAGSQITPYQLFFFILIFMSIVHYTYVCNFSPPHHPSHFSSLLSLEHSEMENPAPSETSPQAVQSTSSSANTSSGTKNSGSTENSKQEESNKMNELWANATTLDDVCVVDDRIVTIMGEDIKKVTLQQFICLCIKYNVTGHKSKNKDVVCTLIVKKRNSRA